jgi:uncharacterized protein (UPF0332 family)
MKPDIEKHLRAADEVLYELEHLMAGGFYKGVVGRAYSAMLHAATAALEAKEIKGETRQGIVPAFADAFVKSGLLDKKYHQYFRQAFNVRWHTDSTSFVSVDSRQAQTTLVRAKDFIAVCRRLCE